MRHVSYKKVMDMMGKITNEELFENKYFTRTGTSTLGTYCVSATSGH